MARDLVGKCYVGIYVYDENGICLEDASKIVSTNGSAKWKIYTVLTQLPENAAGVEFEARAASSVKEYKVQIDTVMMQISEWEWWGDYAWTTAKGFAATNATTLVYNGKVLFLAEKKVDIVASNTGWQILSEEAQTVQLTAIPPELDYVIAVNGETTDATIQNGTLSIAVQPGETAVSVVTREPEVVPTEPATEPSEFTTEASDAPTAAPTVAPTEPVADNDTNGVSTWFIVGILLLLLTDAANGIVLFLNKRKNATK